MQLDELRLLHVDACCVARARRATNLNRVVSRDVMTALSIESVQALQWPQNVFANLSIPIWVLDLSSLAALMRVRSAASPYPARAEMQSVLLQSRFVLAVNAAAVEYHGAAHEDELLNSLARVFVPATMDGIADALTLLLRGESHCESETVLGVRTGVARVRARFDLLDRSDGRLHVAAALLPLARHSNLLDVIPDMLFEINASGIYVDFAGPSIDSPFEARELLGKSLTETLPPDVAHRTLAALQRLKEHGGTERIDYALSMSDGLHWYEARLVALPSGGATAYVRDITERKSTEWQLQESEERFRNMADCAPVLLWMCDRSGYCTFFNKTWLDFTGCNASEERGDGWTRNVHRDDLQHCLQIFRSHLAERKAFRMEYRLRRHDGDDRWLLDHGTPRFSADGDFVGFIGSCIDITDMKASQSELDTRVRDRTIELENANRELEAFSYSVAHDLRQPLRSIKSFTQLILERQRDGLDPQNTHYFGRVLASSECMDRLIDDMLRLARVSRTGIRCTRVDLSALAREIAGQLQSLHPERVVCVTIEADLQVQADAGLLRIALENLLGNAWKFTSATANANIDIGALQQNAETIFFVRDNGAGFDMRHADRLFSAFQRLPTTVKFEGTGIGLAIAHRIFERHHGRLWAQAAPDKGATFFFALPQCK